MLTHNSKSRKIASTISLISIGFSAQCLGTPSVTNDIYNFLEPDSYNNQANFIESYLSVPSSAIVGTIISFPNQDDLHALPISANRKEESVFDDFFTQIHLNSDDGNELISTAKSILSELDIALSKIHPVIYEDTEESSIYLTFQLVIDRDFKTACAIDTAFTRMLVSRVDSIPENLTFEVTSEE